MRRPLPTNDTALSASEERLVEDAMRASATILRRALADAVIANRIRPPASPRLGARPGDLEAPVDEVAAPGLRLRTPLRPQRARFGYAAVACVVLRAARFGLFCGADHGI